MGSYLPTISPEHFFFFFQIFEFQISHLSYIAISYTYLGFFWVKVQQSIKALGRLGCIVNIFFKPKSLQSQGYYIMVAMQI